MTSDTCPTCGSEVRVRGETTRHYEPVGDALREKLERCREVVEAASKVIYYAREGHGTPEYEEAMDEYRAARDLLNELNEEATDGRRA